MSAIVAFVSRYLCVRCWVKRARHLSLFDVAYDDLHPVAFTPKVEALPVASVAAVSASGYDAAGDGSQEHKDMASQASPALNAAASGYEANDGNAHKADSKAAAMGASGYE